MKNDVDSDERYKSNNGFQEKIFDFEDFFRFVKKRMKELEMTQTDLAEKSGIDEYIINRFLKGKKIPNEEQLDKIMEVIGVRRENHKYEIDKDKKSYWIFSYKRIVEILRKLSNEEQDELISMMELWANLKVERNKNKNQYQEKR